MLSRLAAADVRRSPRRGRLAFVVRAATKILRLRLRMTTKPSPPQAESAFIGVHPRPNRAVPSPSLLSCPLLCDDSPRDPHHLHNPSSATDLGYLLHKHPDRYQVFDLACGKAHVFYPEATAERCTAALLLDVDPVALVRGRGASGEAPRAVRERPALRRLLLPQRGDQPGLPHRADRPLGGATRARRSRASRCEATPAGRALPRGARPCCGAVRAARLRGRGARHPLDERFPSGGRAILHRTAERRHVRCADLLLAPLRALPVLDNQQALLGRRGRRWRSSLATAEGWLAGHPERELITRATCGTERSPGPRGPRQQLRKTDEAPEGEEERRREANGPAAEPQQRQRPPRWRRGYGAPRATAVPTWAAAREALLSRLLRGSRRSREIVGRWTCPATRWRWRSAACAGSGCRDKRARSRSCRGALHLPRQAARGLRRGGRASRSSSTWTGPAPRGLRARPVRVQRGPSRVVPHHAERASTT